MTKKTKSSAAGGALIEHSRPADEIIISFAGPFSWPGTADAPCVYEAEESREPGIYLWTVPGPDGHLVYYIGETGRTFETRLRQHYGELAAARYHVYSAPELARGEKVCLWPGRYDAVERKSDEDCQVNCKQLSGQIRQMMLVIRFFLAPLSCDTRVRRRIEAAIAHCLYAAPGIIGRFQDRGIRYWSRVNDEQPIACKASFPIPILGMPDRFWA